MNTIRYDVLQVAREVLEDESSLVLRAGHYCRSLIEPDYDGGVVLPMYENGSLDARGRHALVGRNLFKVTENPVLPLYRLEKPTDEGYRKPFIRASEKFDDGSKTVVAQVSHRIVQKDLEFDVPSQTHIPITSSQIGLRFTERGYVISAEIDNPEMFIEEHKLIVQFMQFIGNMRKFSKNMSPDEAYHPRIPLVRFSLNANTDAVAKVHEMLAWDVEGMSARFTVGSVLPPKLH